MTKSILPKGFDKLAQDELYAAIWAINSAIVDAQNICVDRRKMGIYKKLEKMGA